MKSNNSISLREGEWKERGKKGAKKGAHAWQKSVPWKLTIAKRNESGVAAGETMGDGIVIAY